jgi:hypothetical protein
LLPDETVNDGEVGELDQAGRPSFNVLQNYGSSNRAAALLREPGYGAQLHIP